MSLHLRYGLLALAAVSGGGCAQVDSTGLSTSLDGTDGALQPFDFSSTDTAQSGDPDFAVPSTDLAGDMGSGIQVCNVGKLRINEVATQGTATDSATDEFVEIYNPCGGNVTMSGAKLVYRSAAGTADTPALWAFTTEVIGANQFFLIANGGFPGTADAKPFQNNGGLSSTGGGVGLRDSAGNLVDSVGWGTATNAFVEGTPVGAPSPSQSAARKTDGVDTNNNIADFKLAAPTPGAPN